MPPRKPEDELAAEEAVMEAAIKRERRDMFAAAALTGLLASDNGLMYDTAAMHSVLYANAIMKKLDAE